MVDPATFSGLLRITKITRYPKPVLLDMPLQCKYSYISKKINKTNSSFKY